MGIDDFLAVNLENGQDFVFFGSAYTNFFIGSNGYITFGDGDTTFDPALMNHFALPRISGFFHDFDVTKGGRVSWEQLEDRAVVTFENVQEFASTNDCSYQYELFFEGEIRLTYPASRLSNGIIGLSSGPGEVPVDFTESDLSSYGACGEGLLLRWPVTPGRAYVLEAGSAVSNLSTVYGPVTAEVGSASMQWSEGKTATAATNRFYRIGVRLP